MFGGIGIHVAFGPHPTFDTPVAHTVTKIARREVAKLLPADRCVSWGHSCVRTRYRRPSTWGPSMSVAQNRDSLEPRCLQHSDTQTLASAVAPARKFSVLWCGSSRMSCPVGQSCSNDCQRSTSCTSSEAMVQKTQALRRKVDERHPQQRSFAFRLDTFMTQTTSLPSTSRVGQTRGDTNALPSGQFDVCSTYPPTKDSRKVKITPLCSVSHKNEPKQTRKQPERPDSPACGLTFASVVKVSLFNSRHNKSKYFVLKYQAGESKRAHSLWFGRASRKL